MTQFHLNKRRVIPTAALAVALSASLVGCSAPADEAADTPEPTAQEAAAETAPEPESEPEPVAEEPVVDKSQLVASISTYAEDTPLDPSVQKLSYDDEGRLTAIESSHDKRTWAYDTEGRIAEETNAQLGEFPSERVVTYTYDSEGALEEMLVEDSAPAIYQNPETGEWGEDPTLGELVQDAGESYRVAWAYSDDGKQRTGEYRTLEGDFIQTVVSHFESDARNVYDTVSTDPEALGFGESDARVVEAETLDEAGNVVSETTYTYDASGNMLDEATTEAEGGYAFHYTYDDKGNITAESSEWSGDENSGASTTTEWTYNAQGRPTEKVTRDAAQDTVTFSFYTYDSAGRLKAITEALSFDGELFCNCTAYDYLADNEELSSTPEQLMAEARATVEAA